MLAEPAPAFGASRFRARQQRLEIAADEARAMLGERRVLLDSAETRHRKPPASDRHAEEIEKR